MARPDRSLYYGRWPAGLGFEVVHYNTQGYQNDPFVPVEKGFPAALRHVLWRTDHDVYFTSLSFIPSLCLYVNRLLRGRPYVFNYTGVKWEMFRDRASKRPFSAVWERYVYPFLMDRVFAGASKIVCNSRFLEAYVSSLFPRYRSKLLTIYNGIEYERYSSGNRIAIPGVDAGDVTILCVTALNFDNKSKGVQLVLDAFEQVWAKRKNVKLVIAAKTASERYTKDAEAALQSKAYRDRNSFFQPAGYPRSARKQ